jgi:membrane protein
VPEAEKPKGVWAILRARLLSFGLILGLVFLLMVSLAVSTGIAALGTWVNGLFPGWKATLQAVNIVVSMGFTTLLFAMIFKLMPTARIAWRDVWTGAFVTAILFEVGKLLISLYLGKSGVTESFAAAGSLVVLLAWVYYAAQIFLLGAEFTKVFADEHGSLSAARAVTGTATAVTGMPPEVLPARPPRTAPAMPPAVASISTTTVVRVPLQAAKAALISEVIALMVVSVAGALLSNRRKGLQKKLRWAMRTR